MKWNSKAVSLAVAALLLLPLGAVAGGLDLVPPDAVTVGVANVAQFRSSPLAGRLFDQADRMTIDGEGAKFLEETGLDPARDLDLVTFALAPKRGEPDAAEVLVVFEGRFDVAKIGTAMRSRGAVPVDHAAGTYYELPGESDDREGHGRDAVIALVDRGLILAGSSSAVVRALGLVSTGGGSFIAAGALAPGLARIDPTASAWVLVDVPRTTRLHHQPDWKGEEGHPAGALLESVKRISTVSMWTTDSGDALAFGVTATSTDAETLDLLEDAARGALATWRLAVQEKDPDMVDVIRRFRVRQDGDGVTLSGSIEGETLRKFTSRHGSPL
ncbi:MAG TPA: hypothetical protein VMS56_02560 [Thermoanaerobaculia bacterium]|nr:hypothetical protein [Thermoanaerobaculia bacterium]